MSINKVDIIYVNYKYNNRGLYPIILILKILGIYGKYVVIDNSPTSNGVSNGEYNRKIKGTNKLQDFSGYYEGLELLDLMDSKSRYVLFINDTLHEHRVFGLISHVALIIELMRLKYKKESYCLLISEISGEGIGEVLYGLPIEKTFSSYLFLVDRESIFNFFSKYFNLVDRDIVFMNKIKSISNSISNQYLENLNGYLGYSQESILGKWKPLELISSKIKLEKAKCLILERMIPTFILLEGGKIQGIYDNRVIKFLYTLEWRVRKWIMNG